jgi:hypothetical protein
MLKLAQEHNRKTIPVHKNQRGIIIVKFCAQNFFVVVADSFGVPAE